MTRKKKIVIGSLALLGLGATGFFIFRNYFNQSIPGSLVTSNNPVQARGNGFVVNTTSGSVSIPEGTMIRNGSGKEVFIVQGGRKVYLNAIPSGRSMTEVISVPAEVFNAIPGTRLNGFALLS